MIPARAARSAGAPPRYDAVAIALHWLIAAALLAQVVLGWVMQEIPKQPQGPRAFWFNTHKSIGLTLGALIVVRLAWRLTHRPPPLPDSVARWQAIGAPLLHRLLYVVMLALPLSGYLGSAWSGRPVRYFGITLPQWAGQDDALKDALSIVHSVAGWLLIALLVGHLAAAFGHLATRDGIFRRMWPGSGRTPAPASSAAAGLERRGRPSP
jgi:cytochrome b561